MTVFAALGFAGALIVGGYFTFAGFQLWRITMAFGGRLENLIGVFIGLVGVAIIALAVWFSPFSVTIQ